MRKASEPGPAAVPFVHAAAGTVADAAAGWQRSIPTDTFGELRELCERRDTGSLSEAEFTARNAALLQCHDRRLSTSSPLLISGKDAYAEERAASW